MVWNDQVGYRDLKLAPFLHQESRNSLFFKNAYTMTPFTVEIINGMTAKELTKILLDKYHLLIKDLSGKTDGIRQYAHIAVRKEQDNEKLIRALREVFQEFNA